MSAIARTVYPVQDLLLHDVAQLYIILSSLLRLWLTLDPHLVHHITGNVEFVIDEVRMDASTIALLAAVS